MNALGSKQMGWLLPAAAKWPALALLVAIRPALVPVTHTIKIEATQ